MDKTDTVDKTDATNNIKTLINELIALYLQSDNRIKKEDVAMKVKDDNTNVDIRSITVTCKKELTDIELGMTTLLIEYDAKQHQLLFITGNSEESLEEKILNKITSNIKKIYDTNITVREYQKVIENTRELLTRFKQIKASFSTHIIRILKEVTRGKKMSYKLENDDVKHIIEELDNFYKEKLEKE